MTNNEPQSLLAQYRGLIMSEARRYRIDGDDLSQQVAWHLLREAKCKVSMPLIVRRAAHEIAGLRRKTNAQRGLALDELGDIQDSRPTENIHFEAKDAVDALLASASPAVRRVTTGLLAGWTFEELAPCLGLNTATAKSRFRRFALSARQTLNGEHK